MLLSDATPLPNRPFLSWPQHLALLAAVLLLAAALAALDRRYFARSRALRLGIGALLAADTIACYGYQLRLGQLSFPGHLPLELCQATLVLTLLALFTGSAFLFDLAYYPALAGSSMALLTPDLWEPFPSLATVQFFVDHGLVVASVLYLVWSGRAWPRPGSALRSLAAVNLWAMLVGVFNWRFHTNYMYLCAKPGNASLLSLFGPWPWYLACGELAALALFLLLALPFGRPWLMAVRPQANRETRPPFDVE
jgi:hypothetical integral membrane protein (TIGR02206 family)